MTPQENTVREIEVTVEDLKAKIAKADKLDQLHRSAAFKELIVKDFLEGRAIELARSAGQASLNEMSAKVHGNGLITISGIQSYFHSIYAAAHEAREALASYEEELAEVRNNG